MENRRLGGGQLEDARDQLWKALRAGDQESVETIVDKHRVLVNATDKHGRTPLHLASRHETLTQFFLQRGADVNTADRIFGKTALHWAVRANRARVVRLRPEYGANLAARTKKGETPLAIAKRHGMKRLISPLETAGATE